MKRKWISLFFLTGALLSSSAFANLPASAITKYAIPAYGIYTTADPTCMNGLKATTPLKATATDVDFATAPSLGTGKIPGSGIHCVIIVAKLHIDSAWAAGTYSGTSHFGTSTFNDSNCNSGGTEVLDSTANLTGMGCGMGSRSTQIDWPDAIKADMNALGMTYATDCAATNSGMVVPLYLSTYSKCVGDTVSDATIGGACDWTTNAALNPGDGGYRTNQFFQAPTAADDPDHGIHINAIQAGKNKFKFVVDPTVALSGNGGSSCGGLGPPRFSFAEY